MLNNAEKLIAGIDSALSSGECGGFRYTYYPEVNKEALEGIIGHHFSDDDLIVLAREAGLQYVSNMDEFDDELSDCTPTEIAKMVSHSFPFSTQDEYFCYYPDRSGLDRLESGSVDELVDFDDIWRCSDAQDWLSPNVIFEHLDCLLNDLFYVSGNKKVDDVVFLLASTLRDIFENAGIIDEYLDKDEYQAVMYILKALRTISYRAGTIRFRRAVLRLEATLNLYQVKELSDE